MRLVAQSYWSVLRFHCTGSRCGCRAADTQRIGTRRPPQDRAPRPQTPEQSDQDAKRWRIPLLLSGADAWQPVPVKCGAIHRGKVILGGAWFPCCLGTFSGGPRDGH